MPFTVAKMTPSQPALLCLDHSGIEVQRAITIQYVSLNFFGLDGAVSVSSAHGVAIIAAIRVGWNEALVV